MLHNRLVRRQELLPIGSQVYFELKELVDGFESFLKRQRHLEHLEVPANGINRIKEQALADDLVILCIEPCEGTPFASTKASVLVQFCQHFPYRVITSFREPFVFRSASRLHGKLDLEICFAKSGIMNAIVGEFLCVLIPEGVRLLQLWPKEMARDFDEIVLRWLIHLNSQSVPPHRLVFLENLEDFFTLQNIKDGHSLISHPQDAPRLFPVGLHAREVPAAELLRIENAITVQIQIFHGCFELVLLKWLSERRRKLPKFLQINRAIAIFVKLFESLQDHVCELLVLVVSQSFEGGAEPIEATARIVDVREFKWLLLPEPFAAYLLQELVCAHQLFRVLPPPANRVVDYWSLGVVIIVVLLLLEVGVGDIADEDQEYDVERVFASAGLEFLVRSRRHHDSLGFTFFLESQISNDFIPW